ncbi:MAG: hypothetical protein PHR38_00085 [Bacteroidales bacterium]|nr:hypothetical protein [Bacteroidales bacterium]MDD3907461.1 hypothetical protein [Bacteroidales bacterium]MDD4711940.1 hypothetical protein [Bacteroidales bacterium]
MKQTGFAYSGIAFLFAFLMLFSSCVINVRTDKDSKFKRSESGVSFVQSYPISQPVNLRLSTSGGNISIVGYDGEQVEVSFLVTKNGRILDMTLDELKKIAQVKIINDKSNLGISIDKITERNISVGFEVKTPVNTAATLNTSGGNISISDLNAYQNMSTSGGNIHINNIVGKIEAGTSGGNIVINHSTGDVNASTSGGNISVNGLKGNIKTFTSGGNIHVSETEGTVDVSTSGGSIHMDEISGSVCAYTSGGNISVDVNLLTENLQMETSGGSINCTIPKGLGLNLDLSADNIETQLLNFSGTSEKNKILGTMNGGGIPVSLKTSGGYINLNYK